jgi:hypothetical protein
MTRSHLDTLADRSPRQRSRRIFTNVALALSGLLVGWAATGQPFPGAVITATPSDLVDPTQIVGIYGVTPTSIAIERLDGVAFARDWTGITARYNNADGSLQVFVYVANTPFGELPDSVTTDPGTHLLRTQDSTGTQGIALHWSLPGQRYAGISVWATQLPEGIEEFIVALAAHQTR